MKTMQKKCLAVCLSLFVLPYMLLSAESSSNSDCFLKTKKEAEQGKAFAQYNLGFMYSTGEGVPQDYGKACEWYQKSAEQGNAKAQCNLGNMYDKGYGVPKDKGKALNWYLKAAEQWFAEAQYNLGVLYSAGDGVPQDYGKAYSWYSVAATFGYDGAKEKRDKVAEKLSPEDLLKAQAMATEIFERIHKKKKKEELRIWGVWSRSGVEKKGDSVE